MKLALAHDYLNQFGGAERVLNVLHHEYPRAPIYTSLYDARATNGVFDQATIRTSFLQKVPFVKQYHHPFSLFMPLAFEQLDTSAFETVLSISSSFAKGIITKPSTRHICYCLTPPRYLWDDAHKYVEEFHYPRLVKSILPPFLSYLRMWDRDASSRVDEFIAISNFVRERIRKYYNREAQVIYPPIDVSKFHISHSGPRDYFLMVGRLVAYKKFDMAIRVFNDLQWPLKIVGTGVDEKYLRTLAGPTIEFVGQISDEKLAEMYAGARALIFPQEEDFGIVPLEAMASGRPVLAYRGGGAMETILDGVTGTFFEEQTEESLKASLLAFKPEAYNPNLCRTRALKFDTPVFLKNMRRVLLG